MLRSPACRLRSTSNSFRPGNSGRPINISVITTASENRSLRASSGAPTACSGDT
jgi:hypothetical protein